MTTMRERRLQLHEILCETLGSRNVYFQPPESVKIKYPAIVYGLDDVKQRYADDIAYQSYIRFAVTVIDKDPDSSVIERVVRLPYCSFNRNYKRDNLNHTVFRLFF